MIDLIKEQLPAIITGILGLGAWLNEKRKKKAEVQKVESDATRAMQETYKTFVADMNANYAELKAKVDLLEAEVAEWRTKYYELKKSIDDH